MQSKKSFFVAAHDKKALDIHAQGSTIIWGNFGSLEKNLFFFSGISNYLVPRSLFLFYKGCMTPVQDF